jgi:hypothetical protein
MIEETFFPQLATSSPIMTGIEEVPALHGYVGTSPKDTAQVILTSNQGDPILATWQYGLGRSVAFTSDATGRWASDWIGWAGFSQFWSQVVDHVAAQQNPSQMDIQVVHNGEQAQIIVDAHQVSGTSTEDQEYFLNGYDFEGNIVAPDNSTQTIPLHQTAPGRYEGVFSPNQQGVYLVHVNGSKQGSSDQEPLGVTSGWVLSYSPEYHSLEADPDAIYRLVVSSGGRIATQNPADVFKHSLSSPPSKQPVWPTLLFTSLLLLPVDIAIRRLVFTQTDIKRFLSKIKSRDRRVELTEQKLPRLASIENLFKVKEQTSRRRSSRNSLKATEGIATEDTAKQNELEMHKASITNKSMEIDNRLEENSKKSQDTQNTTARLLAHKRSREEGVKRKKQDEK